MRRHTIKLSTSAHYLFLPHENSLYSWQASSVCHQAVTIYNTLSDAPAGLTQHLHTRELCSSKPVSPHQPRKPVPWVTHPAGSSCSQVPHETKAPLLVSTSIAQGSTGKLQLSGTLSKTNEEHWGPAVFCTPSSNLPHLPHTGIHTLAGTLSPARGADPVEIPPCQKKWLVFSQISSSTPHHRSCYKGPGEKHMARAEEAPELAWTQSCWSPDNYTLLTKVSPHTWDNMLFWVSWIALTYGAVAVYIPILRRPHIFTENSLFETAGCFWGFA